MLRLHLDHRIKQSRIVSDVLSSDRDSGFYLTSLRVSDRLGDDFPHCRFVWRQCTESCVRPVAVTPYGVCIQPLLDGAEFGRNKRDSPPPFQTPEQPLNLGVELSHPRRTPSVLDASLDHRQMKRLLKLNAAVGDDEPRTRIRSDRRVNQLE